jgi:hypothetical protein
MKSKHSSSLSFSSEPIFQWGVILGMIGASFIATFVSFELFDSAEEDAELEKDKVRDS